MYTGSGWAPRTETKIRFWNRTELKLNKIAEFSNIRNKRNYTI